MVDQKIRYKILPLDLATARSKKEYELPGYHICVVKLDGSATLRLNKTTADELDLSLIEWLSSPFSKFYVTNTAQSGKTLILAIGSRSFAVGKTQAFLPLDGSGIMADNLRIHKADGRVSLGTYDGMPALVLHELSDNLKGVIAHSDGYPFDFWVYDVANNVLRNPFYYDYVADEFGFDGDVDFNSVTAHGDAVIHGMAYVDGIVERILNAGVTIEGVLLKDSLVDALGFKVNTVAGVDGSFTTVDGKTVTVSKGLITSIV